MNDTELAEWTASNLAYLTETCGQAPWTDATSERAEPMNEATERTIDPLAILEDLDARRRTLTEVERERYRACIVTVCALFPAARAAYLKWSESLIDIRTSAAVVIAAARAEEETYGSEEGEQ